MTRLQQELSGKLGGFWEKSAEKLIQKVKKDIEDGKIIIDNDGVARNQLGRVIMSDLAEVVSMVSDKFDEEATKAERKKETEKFLKEYRKRQEKQVLSTEEMAEMRSTFGSGVVVDVASGRKYKL